MPKLSEDKKLIILTVIIILSGITLGFLYSSLSEHHPHRSQAACESVGGDWSPEQGTCLLSYKEAGEACTDGGQCISGVCLPPVLTAEQEAELSNGPLENIVGTCYPEELVFACVRQVLKGVVTKESLCRE